MLRTTVITILAAVMISACGRATPANLQPPATIQTLDSTQAESTAVQTTVAVSGELAEPVPNVVGTFNPPTAGVKVTSANTVVEPLKQVTQTTVVPEAATTQETSSPGVAQTYVVESGDTVSVIANDKFGISVADLLEINDIGDRDEIKPGQVLKIPSS